MKKTILILDDDYSVVSIIEKLMRDDYSIVTATNALTALNQMLAMKFDAIIFDVRMPIVDGIKFYGEAVKVQPLAKYICISANDHGPIDCAFLQKPFSIQAIVSLIEGERIL